MTKKTVTATGNLQASPAKLEGFAKRVDVALSADDEWAQFLNWMSKHQSPRWVFRGESNSEWKLKPKVGRNDLSYSIGRELLLLEEFKKRSIAHIERPPDHADDLSWMTIAQHHGLPTRLIDWSYNPLVAAHFACESVSTEKEPEKAGVIYAVCPSDFGWLDHRESNYDFLTDTNERFLHPSAVAARIISQQSLFSIHPTPKSEWNPGGSLVEFPVKPEVKIDIRRRVLGLGVDHYSLMGGLDGLSAALEWRYQSEVPLR